ncbi:MAG: molybdenum cofactor biosynthesis protein MoaE, partial [Pseudomonadota bacterium]
MTVRVQQEDFDLGAELLVLREGNPRIGAIASFLGLVRDINEGDAVAGMSL